MAATLGFSWFFAEVYLWMIVIRIMASWFISSMTHPWVRLWVVTTDPVIKFLEKLMPPAIFQGEYLYDLPIFLMLLVIVFGKHLYHLLAEG